ncbi:MAG: ribosome biogenesis GTPase YlqF [Lactobacillales bacterium]|jgi:ribosome biogenesis GTPase A|nr:ribosome biogenesis GTPase YlqF [Lactobacillales bacterium]
MTNIQWFPGHMAKARKEVQEKLRFVDIVYEMVDARLPISSRNPMLDQILKQKPRLILMNKTDLSDITQTKKWQEWFESQGQNSLVINAQDNVGVKKVFSENRMILKKKIDREQIRGLKPRAVRAMVVGIPNVGKSTLINRLIGKKKAQVGNRPGITKGQQWLRLDYNLELLDTPGILWPKFENEEVGKKLALIGAIKDALLHVDDLALYVLEFFLKHFPNSMQKYYQLTNKEMYLSPVDLLMSITRKQGYCEDYERASQKMVLDVRSGKLGRYTLDLFEEKEVLLGGELS